MTTINPSQFNPSTAPVNLGGVEATNVIQKQEGVAKKQNELPPLGDGKGPDTVSYSRPNPLQPHALKFLVDPSTTDTISADITSLLVLLIKTQNQNRASQRHQWLLQAQNVLQTAASVAEEKKKAALIKFASDTVTNGIDLAQNVASAGTSFAGAGEEAKGSIEINATADAEFGTDEELAPSKGGDVEGEDELSNEESLSSAESGFEGEGGVEGSTSSKSSTSTTKSSTESESKIKEDAKAKSSSETEETQQSDKAQQSKSTEDAKSGKTETESEKKAKSNSASRSKKTEAEKKDLRTRKEEYIAKRQSSLNSQIDRKDKQISSITGAFSSLGKEVSAGLNVASEYATANAEQLKGLEDYQSSLASEQLDYANQLRDNAQKLLETLKSIEQARHQAVSAIVNI
jgi:hypothetical protein